MAISVSSQMQPKPISEGGVHKVPKTDGEAKLEEFIYLVSHDVRACLRAIIEVPQWIKEDLQDEGYPIVGSFEQNLRLLETNTSRLDRMMEDLLVYSRVGRLQGNAISSASQAMSSAVEKLNVPRAFLLTSELPVDELRLGSEDLERVFSAVIENSIKHHDLGAGQIRIATQLEGKNTILRITDDGPGIDPKYFDKVVEPMTTLMPRDEVEGSGMGLSIVNKVARHYGGVLSLSTGLDGRGLTVELVLPSAA